jgi:hypothetical protein
VTIRYRGALLFALLQAVPPIVRDEDSGRFSLAFGLGDDAYHQSRGSCNGLIAERRVRSRTLSGTVHVPVNERLSLEAFGGRTTSDSSRCYADDCQILPPAFLGEFGGFRLRVDGEKGGVAFGFAALPVAHQSQSGEIRGEHSVEPSLMLRLGRAGPGRRHLRGDLNYVSVPGAVPMNSIGVVFTGKSADPFHAFVGVAQPPYSLADHGRSFWRGELLFHWTPNVAMNVGALGGGHLHSSNAGLRIFFGGQSLRTP